MYAADDNRTEVIEIHTVQKKDKEKNEKGRIFVTVLVAIVVIIAISIAAILFYFKNISYPRDKDGIPQRFRVNCEEDRFQATRTDYMFVPGYDVFLIFPVHSSDETYSFSAEGVENLEAEYYPDMGYLITFEMPENDVSVSFEIRSDSAITTKEQSSNINIVLEENPTTGFEWEYEIVPEGVLELKRDQYVNEPMDPKDPVDGSGGTHFWSFQVIGSGIVEIRFVLRRGTEELPPVKIFRYECDETGAVSVE